MKAKIYFIVSLLFLCNLFANISCKKPLVLDDLIKGVIKSNPVLQSKYQDAQAASFDVTRARMPKDPKFIFHAKDNQIGRGDTFKKERRYGIYQRIPFPGKNRLKRDVAQKVFEFTETKRTQTSLDLILKIKKSYYKLYLSHFLQDLIQYDKDKMSKIIKNNTRNLHEADILQLDIKIQKLYQKILIQEAEQKELEAHINYLLNKPQTTGMAKPQKTFTHKIKLDYETLKRQAIHRSPELAGQQALIEKQKKKAKLARRGYFPDLDISFLIQRKVEADAYSWYIKFGFDIPIWARKKQKKESDAAEARAISHSFRLQNMKNEICANIRSLMAEIEIIEKRIALYENKIIPSENKIMELNKNKDLAFIGAILDKQQTLIICEKLKVEREILLAKLEREVGTPLETIV